MLLKPQIKSKMCLLGQILSGKFLSGVCTMRDHQGLILLSDLTLMSISGARRHDKIFCPGVIIHN